MLNIQDLTVRIEGKTVLSELSLALQPGHIYALMGKNGSGKSTLSHVLVGHEDYEVTGGSIEYQEQDLLALNTEERAHLGVFLSFQYPTAIPGVNNLYFMQSAYNAHAKARGDKELDAYDFIEKANAAVAQVGLDPSFLKRALNDGFSGGEKKRNEMVQMLLLQPKLIILDEIDSGLDVDAMKAVAEVINAVKAPDTIIVIITHYQRMLSLLDVDHVYVLHQGRIQAEGGMELAQRIEDKGYQSFEE